MGLARDSLLSTCRYNGLIVLHGALLALSACERSAMPHSGPGDATAHASIPPTEQAARNRGPIFFVVPTNGARLKSPIRFEFGGEHIAIVSSSERHSHGVNAKMVHYHLGINTECLPAGQDIPKASPWIHFEHGNNTIDMEMPPGQHTFALQAGDESHRALAGACQTLGLVVIE